MSEPILCPDCGVLLIDLQNYCNCGRPQAQSLEKWIAQDCASVRRAALLEAAKAVCPKCRDGFIPSKRCISNPEKFSDFWHRETDIFGIHSDSFCKASPIHALIAKSRAQGEGGGNA